MIQSLSWYTYDCRRFRMCVLVVVLVWLIVVLSKYDLLVFVVVMRRLFMFRRFRQAKYIQSDTTNQINDRHYVVELKSYVF